MTSSNKIVSLVRLTLPTLLATLFTLPVLAQTNSAGDVIVRLRATELNWANQQNNGLATTNVTAQNKAIPEVDVSYFFTKNIATELVLTYPQTVNINVGGAASGTVKALPPTLLLQYHFTELGQIKPYVGVGVNYTSFTSANILNGGASVNASSTGFAAQIGFDYMLDKNWGLNADLKYIQIKTDVFAGGANLGQLGLNPTVASAGLTYRF
jgi:outer membrane protein